MGGRGTFSTGISPELKYQTVEIINGVKRLEPMNPKASSKLPEESNTSSAYVLYTRKGVFHQYREYDEHHKVILEIGYHKEPSLGKGQILHVHIHKKPGVEYHGQAKIKRLTKSDPLYQKHKHLFKGVDL